MYIVGLLFYIGIPALIAYVDTSRAFVAQSFELSPEITVLVGIAYIYPLSVFLLSVFFRRKNFANIHYFRSQVTLSSTLAVSFGLLGTFIGLSEMIARIAVGMGSGGDFADKMTSLLAAIGGALDSMSLAFLTSILGVGSSVAILFSSNYLASFYKEEFNDNQTSGNTDNKSTALNTDVIEFEKHAQVVQNSVQQTLNLVADKGKVWEDLHLLLQNSSKSLVVDQFNETLSQNNHLMTDMANVLKHMHQEQLTSNQKVDDALQGYGDRMTGEFYAVSDHIDKMSTQINETLFQNNHLMTDMTNVLKHMHQEQLTSNQKVDGFLQDYGDRMTGEFYAVSANIHKMSTQIENMENSVLQSATETSGVIKQTTRELSSVANILHDIRVEMAAPLEDILEKALKDESFTLTYQSINDASGTMVGAEVFICWEDRIRGRISNLELFEIASQQGLSSELDQWVMQSALRQLSIWRASGQWNDQWKLSINMTPERLLSPNLITDLEHILRETAVPPQIIALEIADSTIMNQPDACRDKIRQLSNLGVRVYIDDFGIDYSSLMNLQNFEVDALKIDRNIIRQLLESESFGLPIIETIMVVAKKMNIAVFAERVEIQGDMEKLAEIGCLYFQGYFFSKPLARNDFERQHLIGVKNTTVEMV